VGELSESWQLELGYEAEIEYASGERIVDETGRIDNYALFATAEYRPVSRLVIKPGLRATYNSRFGAPLVPSLNLAYNLSEQRKLRASYAMGFRSPGLKELSFYFVDVNHNIQGNPDLQAEQSQHVSLAFDQYGTGDSPWGFGLNAFYNDITNLITLAQINEVEYSFINIGEQQTKGLQANLSYAKGPWRAMAGGLLTGISNRLSAREDVPNFIYTPEANVQLSYRTESGWTASAFYKFTGSRNFFLLQGDGSVRETIIEGFHTADVSIEKYLMEGRFLLQVGSRNLFNVQNIMAGSGGGVHGGGGVMAVGTGRTYFVRLGWNLNSTVK